MQEYDRERFNITYYRLENPPKATLQDLSKNEGITLDKLSVKGCY